MNYFGMPSSMWILFHRSFRNALVNVLGMDGPSAAGVERRAKAKYREIISALPRFEKGDRFKMNIVSCAMLCAFILNLNSKPTVDVVTEFYKEGMMTGAMKWFCRRSGKRKFTLKDYNGLECTARTRAADRNRYSWNMDFLPYEDGSGYEARFTHCGICNLMKELGLFEYTPAMCRLDYTMSDAMLTTFFVREHTIASGGPYCDCGYKKIRYKD